MSLCLKYIDAMLKENRNNDNLDKIIQEISTRCSKFQKMADDEKLKGLANVIEYFFLKDEKS